MVRPATWLSSVTVGLALAWQASPTLAQTTLPENKQAPARLAEHEDARECDDAECDAAEGDHTPCKEKCKAAQNAKSAAVDKDVVPASVDTESDEAEAEAPSVDGFGITSHVGNGVAEVPISELIKERYPNGSVRIERRATQDAQGNYVNHGSWKMWDERGNPVAQGSYDMGNRTGLWTRWYRNGQDAELFGHVPYSQFPAPYISQASFKHDQLDGLWTIHDSKMRKISQIRFADGKRHGTATWWFASGRKMREIEYRDGDLDGQYLEWNAEGKLAVKDTYQNGHKLAPKLTNHPGGTKKSEGMYLFAKEVEQSPDDWWNCKLMVTNRAGHEERHGAWKSWYTNGQIQLEGNYEHDVQIGTFTWWHSNGQKAQEGRFDHGKQDGDWTWWHANGQKSINGEYTHGNPTGRWTWWKEDGRVVQSADLSHSDGVAVDSLPTTPGDSLMPRATLPKTPEKSLLPRASSPGFGKPIKR